MPRLIDRSRIITDWTCPRKRFWEYEYLNRGIVANNTSLEFFLGLTVHDALAAIAMMQLNGVPSSIDEIALTARQQMLDSLLEKTTGEVDEVDFANEQATLVEGLIRGFYKHVWPRLLTAYPSIIAIEPEVTYQIDDTLLFMARPDLILADTEGGHHYIEYKTTGSKNENWVNSWNTAVQLQSSIKAVEETLGTAPIDVSVIGLYKGYQSYNKQNSVMCYAYKKNGNPPFTQDAIQYEYKAGFKRSPVWEMDGGVKAWVEGMPEGILADQFPMCPPIFVKDDLVNSFFHQVAYREHEILLATQMLEDADDETKQSILDCTFSQTFSECTPYIGHPCMFKKLCHGHVENPLEEGWMVRDGNHLLEKEQFAEMDKVNG